MNMCSPDGRFAWCYLLKLLRKVREEAINHSLDYFSARFLTILNRIQNWLLLGMIYEYIKGPCKA